MQDRFNSLSDFGDFLQDNIKIVFTSIILVLALLGGFVVIGYKNSISRQKAYDSFVELKSLVDLPVKNSDESDNSSSFKTEDEKWTKIREVAHKNFHNHGNVGMGNFFQVFEVNALLKLGKLAEATKILTSALKVMKSSKIRDLLEVKLALMKIDSQEKELILEGLSDLDKIANAGNCASAAAYWHLGEYHWINGNTSEAKTLWNTLVCQYSEKKQIAGDEDLFSSPWVERANDKLKTVQ